MSVPTADAAHAVATAPTTPTPPRPRRSLAPARKALVTLKGAMAEERDSGATRVATASLAVGVLCFAAMPAATVINHPDNSFSAVSMATIKSLIEPAWESEVVARHMSTAPLEDWEPDELRASTFAALLLLEYLTGAIRVAALEHPQGEQLIASVPIGTRGAPELEPLVKALWTLAPTLSWDLGELNAETVTNSVALTPSHPHSTLHAASPPQKARGLIFQWFKTYSKFQAFAARYFMSIPEDLTGFVFMAAKLIETAAAAAVGDAEEQEEAWRCMTSYERALSCPLTLVEGFSTEEEFTALAQDAATPDAIEFLLDSVEALRKAMQASSVPNKFSFAAAKLMALACMTCGNLMSAASGPTDLDTMAVLCSAPFIECIQVTSECWIEMIRLCRDASKLDFWGFSMGGFMTALKKFCEACEIVGEHVADVFVSMAPLSVLRSINRRATTQPAMAAMPLAARALAELGASIPAALALSHASLVASESLQTARTVAASIHNVATGYAMAFIFCSEARTPISKTTAIAAAQAAHACLRAALALRAPGFWPSASAVQQLAINSPLEAMVQWQSGALMFVGHPFAVSGMKETPPLIVLRSLAVLSTLSDSELCSREIVAILGALPKAEPAIPDICAVALPEDAPWLEKLARAGPMPAAVEVLRQMIAAAKSSVDLEQRQRRRLDMLSRLPPGVCGNFRCAEPLPAEKLSVCSGCRTLKYCSAACLRCDWKHGHKAVCQAVQRERGGSG